MAMSQHDAGSSSSIARRDRSFDISSRSINDRQKLGLAPSKHSKSTIGLQQRMQSLGISLQNVTSNIPPDIQGQCTAYYDSTAPALSNRDLDILDILTLVQHWRVNILPVSWNEDEEDIGSGGTAGVRQGVNVRFVQENAYFEFVFKRIHRPGISGADKRADLEAIFSEILVLGHPVIRNHPNIITLEGICFEDARSFENPEEPTVYAWPVLVLRKSHHLDLRKFFAKSQGNLRFAERLKICGEIANAILLMHACNVVHGDLKPENVLIFEDKDGDITAQVSDFGYSSFKTSDQEYITLASSWPWTAPEIELDSETTLAYAKAADVFSFGMLCIWILFVGSTHEAAASDVVNTSFERRLFELKHRDQLVDFAETQIRSLPFIDPDLRAALNDIFTSTLSCAPEERDLTEKKVESAFRCKSMRDGLLAQFSKSAVLPETNLFRLAESYRQFKNTNRSLQRQIFECYKLRVDNDNNEATRNCCAFQLAFCYKVGFGTSVDEGKCKYWLSYCNRPAQDLDDLLFIANDTGVNVQGSLRFHSSMFKDAPKENNSKGKSKITDEFTTNDDGSLSVAEENGPMIGWLHSSMPYFGGRGNNATIKFTNRGRCSDDCKGGHLHDDEWIRAISAEIHEHCERDWGWDFQPHTMVIETKYRQELEPEEVTSEKPLRTVENTSNKVVEVTSNEAAEETSNEAAEETCYEPTRSYQEEGEELKVKRVQVKRRALGETHVDTIESMRDLYLTHLQKGRWLDAEGMSRRIIESLIDELGADHPDTLDFMEQVAKNSNLLGREDLEEEMLIRLIEAKKRLFGIRHKDTISCLERLAPLLFRTGRISEAIALQKEVVETRMTHEGLVPIQSIEALAKLLFLQKNYDSAEPLVKQVLQFKRLSYGDEDVQTVMAMELMAKIYIFHGLRCQEAIQLQEQALVTRKATHGPEHPDTLQCQKDLAVYYNFDKQYEVAEMLFLEVINARKPDPEGPSKDNLQPLQFLAGIYQEQGRLSDYERTHQMVLETKIKTFGAAHPSTIKAKEIQASIYAELQKWEDARRLRQEILSSQRETHGLYEEAVLKSMIDLAITHNHLGLYNQARDMFSEVIDKAKDSLGPRHPLVQNATISLAATYRNMGLSRVAEDLLASLSLLRGDSDMAGPSCKCKKRNVAFVDRKLEDVDKTITQTREAIAALQNQPIDAVHLHWLGETYLHRYRVYTKHQSDLHMLHEWAEKALDATANNSSLKASLLKHWSKVLWLKFKKGAPKVQQYIDEAVEKAEEAVEIAGIHDLDSKPYLSYLSKMLLRRYKYTHDENDLDEARMWAEQAHLLESPPGEVNIPYKRGRLLHRFSKAHLLRFEQIGAPLDLDEGIKYEDASLESLPENACKRRGRLYKHARTLHIHYQVTKTVDSLDRALILCEKAVEMLPNIGMKSFSRAVWLQELSNMYRVRSEATPVDKDLASINYLRRSIDLGRESVDIASNPSLRLPLCVPLSSLAVSYRTLFQITDDRQDLEMALQAIGRATDATSKDDANYSALMDIQLGLQDMLQLWEARMMSLDN